MTVYTKEQEAEALAWVEKGTFCRLDLDVVLAMAKRTAEAEAKLEASRAGSERWHAVAPESQQERDALNAPAPVVVTREAVEWLGAFLDTFAVWAQTDEGDDYARPLNAAAHGAVAIRKMLEVKP